MTSSTSRYILSILAVWAGVSIPELAIAGSASDVQISQIIPGTAGFTFMTTGGTRSAAPACATLPNTWAIDVTTAQGQAMVASAITAFSTGKRMYIGGSGLCPNFQPNGESVFFLAINN